MNDIIHDRKAVYETPKSHTQKQNAKNPYEQSCRKGGTTATTFKVLEWIEEDVF